MPKLQSLYAILGDLAMVSPKLVLMQGRKYFRIEDLWSHARKDLKAGNPKDRAALSEAIYWTTTDEHGKLLLKGVTPKGGEFVAFVEPGSDIPAPAI